MDIKKLNEELENFIINELSYETKKSYLAKKQAQLDNAKRAMEKAQRLVRDTEEIKTGKRTITDEQLSQLLDNIKKEFPTWGEKYFYKDIRKGWGWLEAGDIIETDNSCKINLSYDEKYLSIRIETCKKVSNGRDKHVVEKFSLDDFNFSKLNAKVLSFIKNFMKEADKENNSKVNAKFQKALETLKKLLSKIKADKLDPENDKFDKKISYELHYSNVREFYPAVMSIKGITIPSTLGYENDYQIKGIGLTKELTVGLFYWTEKYTSIDHTTLANIKATKEDKLVALNKLIDILKGVPGRSNLKAQQDKQTKNKELASKVIEEVKDELRKLDRNAEFRPIKEESWGYTFSVRDWGEWGSAGDWEEDNDFMRLRDDWFDKKANIESNLKKKYPDLKISISCGEKRYLDCSVSW